MPLTTSLPSRVNAPPRGSIQRQYPKAACTRQRCCCTTRPTPGSAPLVGSPTPITIRPCTPSRPGRSRPTGRTSCNLLIGSCITTRSPGSAPLGGSQTSTTMRPCTPSRRGRSRPGGRTSFRPAPAGSCTTKRLPGSPPSAGSPTRTITRPCAHSPRGSTSGASPSPGRSPRGGPTSCRCSDPNRRQRTLHRRATEFVVLSRLDTAGYSSTEPPGYPVLTSGRGDVGKLTNVSLLTAFKSKSSQNKSNPTTEGQDNG